jgi:hypothetical protein
MASNSAPDWKIIKKDLEACREEAPMALKLIEGTKKWTLEFPKAGDLSFSFLGGGTNKLVFRVSQTNKPTDWVVGFQSIPGYRTGKKDITDEIDILQRLCKKDVVVPRPFNGTSETTELLITFYLDNYDYGGSPGLVYGFVEEYYDLESISNPSGRFVEMKKKDGELSHWLQNIFNKYKPNKDSLHRTDKTLKLTRQAWNTKKWGDFQVIYDKQTGTLIVFDPNNELGNVAATEAILKQWELDMAKALAKIQ